MQIVQSWQEELTRIRRDNFLSSVADGHAAMLTARGDAVDVGHSTVGYLNLYPWQDVGVSADLASGGISPHSPEAADIAMISAAKSLNRVANGERTAATDFGLTPAPSDGLEAAVNKLGGEASFAAAYLATLENIYTDPSLAGILPSVQQPRGVLTGVTPEDFFADPSQYVSDKVLRRLIDNEKVRQGVDRFGQRPADVADALAKINPRDRSGIPSEATDDELRSLALSGPDPFNQRPKDNPLSRAVGAAGSFASDIFNSTLRDAGSVVMAPWQSVQNMASNAYAEGQKIGEAIQSGDYTNVPKNLLDAATGNYGQAFYATDLGVTLTDAYDTNRDLQGSGFFLGEAGVVERKRRENQFSAFGAEGVFEGDRLTLGRITATATHAEKWSGETGARVMSGFVDAAVALKGPQEKLLTGAFKGLGTVRGVRGVRSVPLLGRVNPMEAGILESAWRRSVSVPKATEFIKQWRGRGVIKSLSEMTNTEEVVKAFGDSIPIRMAESIATTNAANIAAQSGVSLDLAESASQGIISRILQDAIETKKISQVPELSPLTGFAGNLRGANPTLSRIRTIERFRAVMPQGSGVLDPANIDEMWVYARDSMVNGHIPKPERAGLLSDLVAARSNSERMTVLTKDVMGAIENRSYKQLRLRRLHSPATVARYLGRTVTGGADEVVRAAEHAARQDAQFMTHMYTETFDALSRYNVDNLGRNINPFASTVNGVAIDAVVPHSIEEMLHTGIPVIPVGQVRRVRTATAREAPFGFLAGPLLSDIAANPRWYISALEGITAAWKPTVLVKGGYVFKVVGDEQARIAATGGDSLYNNPIGWVAWMIGKGDRGSSILGETTNSTDEFLGVLVGPDRGIGQAVREFHGGGSNAGADISHVYTTVAKGNLDYPKQWANNLAQLSRGRIFSNVAREGVAATVDKILEDPVLLRQFQSLGETQGRALGVAVDLTDRGQLTRLVQSIEERIGLATGNSPVLREAISTGELTLADGAKIAVSDLRNPHTLDSATGGFINHLESMLEFGPDTTKALKQVISKEQKGVMTKKVKNLLGMMGAMFIERPTSRLSRIPFFRQNYWKAVEGNVDLLTPEAASELLGTMPTGLPRDLVRSIKYKLGKVARGESDNVGGFEAKEFDRWAKAKAMNDTNEVLVSMADKNQWEDMLRIMAPFAQAWGEVIRTWGRLLKANPKIIARVDQTFTVLHDPDFADLVGKVPSLDTVSGLSLMYKNDYGQEMIQFPWIGTSSDLAASAWNSTIGNLTGARVHGRPDGLPGTIPFSSSANALSIGASIIPGLGPHSGMLLSSALDRLPQDFTSLKETLFPFGDPPNVDIPGLLKGSIPSWMRYLASASGQGAGAFGTRAEVDSYNGKLIGAKQWLLANGSYDLKNGGIDERNRLDHKAQEIVSWMAWAAFTSTELAFGPTQAGFFLLDDDGKIQISPEEGNVYLTSNVASQIYRSLVDEATAQGMDFNEANDVAATRLIQDYGGGDPQFLATIIGKSKSRLPGGAPVSRETFLWLNEDPSRAEDAPVTWQFFAPQGEDFYYPMYLRTLDMGDRVRFTSQDFSVMVDDTVASLLWQQATDKFRVNGEIIPQARAVTSGIQQELMDSFPGWRNSPNRDSTSTRNVIHELDIVTAPGGKFAEHPNTPAIREIIDMRTTINDTLHSAGFSFSDMTIARSAATESIRQFYDAQLKRIQQENPTMTDVIVSVFRAEINAGLTQDERTANG